jgi:hypothetical protein
MVNRVLDYLQRLAAAGLMRPAMPVANSRTVSRTASAATQRSSKPGGTTTTPNATSVAPSNAAAAVTAPVAQQAAVIQPQPVAQYAAIVQHAPVARPTAVQRQTTATTVPETSEASTTLGPDAVSTVASTPEPTVESAGNTDSSLLPAAPGPAPTAAVVLETRPLPRTPESIGLTMPVSVTEPGENAIVHAAPEILVEQLGRETFETLARLMLAVAVFGNDSLRLVEPVADVVTDREHDDQVARLN